MADESIDAARTFVAGQLRRMAQEAPQRGEYLTGLSAQICADKPCLMMSPDVVAITAAAMQREAN